MLSWKDPEWGRMGQGSAGHIVNAIVPQTGNVFPRDIAGAFSALARPAIKVTALRISSSLMLSSMMMSAPASTASLTCSQRFNLHLDLADERRILPGHLDGLRHAAGSADVVILQQNAVGQAMRRKLLPPPTRTAYFSKMRGCWGWSYGCPAG